MKISRLALQLLVFGAIAQPGWSQDLWSAKIPSGGFQRNVTLFRSPA